MPENPPPAKAAFLAHAAPARRERVDAWLADASWEARQAAFLALMDAYAHDEMARGPDHLIQFHEAGGNWRILFPHLRVRPNPEVADCLARVMAARQAYADRSYYRGFPDTCEVHHDVETFLYFQIPLFHLGVAGGSAAALRSICTVADHCGNWSAGVPAWYDWGKHGFVSTWLGTRAVRDYPPFDYQEANHFRFIDLCTTAYVGTREARYLALAEDSAGRWCSHIEAHGSGGPIPCQILPPGAISEELGHAGAATKLDRYQVFYATMAANTAYDIGMALLDLYALTAKPRYLACFRLLLQPFFGHARKGRPPRAFARGAWQYDELGLLDDPRAAINQSCVFVPRMALKHDLVTRTETYRQPLLAWAEAIDEARNSTDQAACDVMVAAHFYTRETAYLARGYAMALRTWAVCEDNMGDHGGNGTNCNAATRYGSKFMMESLYLPLLGSCDWGTRGNLPDRPQADTDGEGYTNLEAWRHPLASELESAHTKEQVK